MILQKKKLSNGFGDNIKIGKQGEIMYMLPADEGYYPVKKEPAIQFVKYLYDKEGLQRMVKEIAEGGKETFSLINYYNEDGIEEKQVIEDEYGVSMIQRLKNRPEIIKFITYDSKEKNIASIQYWKRRFLLALEDLTPNLIEVDPVKINPFIMNEEIGHSLYEGMTEIEERQIRNSEDEIWPLPEITREEQLQYYKRLNERYHRTKAFELGIEKILSIRNRERMEEK